MSVVVAMNVETKRMEQYNDIVANILRVLKGTGLRESELTGLNISDLYLNNDMPYIKIIGKGKYRELEARAIYLTGEAVNAFKEWLEYGNGLENIVDNDAVFINKNGNRLSENNIQFIFRTYGDGMSCHMIRHWYATLMPNTGNIVFEQQQPGHSSVDTTVNSYANGAYGMKDMLTNM